MLGLAQADLAGGVAGLLASTSPFPVLLSPSPFQDGFGDGDEFTGMSHLASPFPPATAATISHGNDSSSQLFPIHTSSKHYQLMTSTQQGDQLGSPFASASSTPASASVSSTPSFVDHFQSPANGSAFFGSLFNLHIDKQWKFAEVILIIVISAILNLVTVVGNIMVLISFKMDRSLQTVSNYFLLSLALADLLIGLISMPFYTLYLLLNYWPLGALMCDIWLAIDYMNSNAAVLNMLVISFDRYFSVTRPLTYRAKRTTKHACLMISFAWILSLTIWTPAIFIYPHYKGRTVQGTDKCEIEFVKANTYLTFMTAMLAFYVPVTIMIYLYWRIWLETKKRYRDLTTLFLVSGVGAAAPVRPSRPPQVNSSAEPNNTCPPLALTGRPKSALESRQGGQCRSGSAASGAPISSGSPRTRQPPEHHLSISRQLNRNPSNAKANHEGPQKPADIQAGAYIKPASLERARATGDGSAGRALLRAAPRCHQQVPPAKSGCACELGKTTLGLLKRLGGDRSEGRCEPHHAQHEPCCHSGRVCANRKQLIAHRMSRGCQCRQIADQDRKSAKRGPQAQSGRHQHRHQHGHRSGRLHHCHHHHCHHQRQPSAPMELDDDKPADGHHAKATKLALVTSSCQHLLMGPNNRTGNGDSSPGATKSLSCASILRKVHPTELAAPRDLSQADQAGSYNSLPNQERASVGDLDARSTGRSSALSEAARAPVIGIGRPPSGQTHIAAAGEIKRPPRDDSGCKDEGDDKDSCRDKQPDLEAGEQLDCEPDSLDCDLETRIVSVGDRLQFQSYHINRPSEVYSAVGQIDAPSAARPCHQRPYLIGCRDAALSKQACRLDCKLCSAQSAPAKIRPACSRCSQSCRQKGLYQAAGSRCDRSSCRVLCGSEVASSRDPSRHSRSTRPPACPECARLLAGKRAETDQDESKTGRREGEPERVAADNKLPILGALSLTVQKAPPLDYEAGAPLERLNSHAETEVDDIMFQSRQSDPTQVVRSGSKKEIKKASQRLTFKDAPTSRTVCGKASEIASSYQVTDKRQFSREAPAKEQDFRCSIVGMASDHLNQPTADGPSPNGSHQLGCFTSYKNALVRWLSRLLARLLRSSHTEGSRRSNLARCDPDIENLQSSDKFRNSYSRAFSYFKTFSSHRHRSNDRESSSTNSKKSFHQDSSPSSAHDRSTIAGQGYTNINKLKSNSSNSNNNKSSSNSSTTKPSYSTHHPIQPKSERKAAKTLSTLLLVFIVTWLPYDILVLIKTLSGGEDLVPEKVWNFSYYLCYINSTINPLCYALCNAQFRRTYMRILKCKLSNEHNSSRRLVPIHSSSTWNKMSD